MSILCLRGVHWRGAQAFLQLYSSGVYWRGYPGFYTRMVVPAGSVILDEALASR